MDSSPPSNPRDEAYSRLVRLDPNGAVEARDHLAQLQDHEVKAYQGLNDGAMQILGAVNNQRSWQAAKAEAHRLYASHGQDSSFIDQLPDQYSPDVVKNLQMTSMKTKDMIGAELQRRKVDWSIEDGQIDNNRADENLQSLEGQRTGALANTRRGQDLAHGDRVAGQAVRVRGQDIRNTTTQRGQTMTDARVRGSASYLGTGGRGRGMGGGAPAVAVGPNGHKIVVKDGRWVDAATLQPVQ